MSDDEEFMGLGCFAVFQFLIAFGMVFSFACAIVWIIGAFR